MPSLDALLPNRPVPIVGTIRTGTARQIGRLLRYASSRSPRVREFTDILTAEINRSRGS